MRCKKHFNDFSSYTGVCASCLRERLFVLIIAQNEYNQAQKQDSRLDATDVNDDDLFPVVFPRSVSPDYVSCRQSDCGIDGKLDGPSLANQRFYSTPQVGPNGKLIIGAEGRFYEKRKNGMQISWFSHLFRSKSEKHNPGVSDPCRNADTVDTGSNSWHNSFWLGKMFSTRRSTITVDQSTAKGNRGVGRVSNKGVPPARFSDEEGEQWNHRSSGSSSECSMSWNKTPKRTPAWVAPGRRGGNGKSGHSRNATGFGFCWSPLVRASPSRHWNHKGISTEAIVSGDMPVAPVKPPACNVVALCKNRSRKLADFGRFRHNR